jgi:alpha-beta hydrolase superfamily lysophospholipase
VPAPIGNPSAASLPRSVSDRARFVRLGPDGVPALLAHPDWATPSPFCLWLHGRTAAKEIDPGRYSRWLRAGIAVCAIDLPGHGKRDGPIRHEPIHTLAAIREAVGEIDGILGALENGESRGLFDPSRAAIGGMSMGGMVALRRLCEAHRFVCAAVEATTGNLKDLYFPPPEDRAEPWPVDHDRAEVASIDPSEHLAGFEPIPLLVMHSEADRMIPWRVQARFIDRLRTHYEARGLPASMVETRTWPDTGAPGEHIGFGRVSNDAKNIQTDFLARHLGAQPR